MCTGPLDLYWYQSTWTIVDCRKECIIWGAVAAEVSGWLTLPSILDLFYPTNRTDRNPPRHTGRHNHTEKHIVTTTRVATTHSDT